MEINSIHPRRASRSTPRPSQPNHVVYIRYTSHNLGRPDTGRLWTLTYSGTDRKCTTEEGVRRKFFRLSNLLDWTTLNFWVAIETNNRGWGKIGCLTRTHGKSSCENFALCINIWWRCCSFMRTHTLLPLTTLSPPIQFPRLSNPLPLSTYCTTSVNYWA
jgi:hypothetical protein